MKKTMKKIVALGSGAALLVTASVMGTMAYLTSNTEVVNNTFTVGNVAITLDEEKVDVYGVDVDEEKEERVMKNEYKLIPGHSYTKDPTVHVTKGSEKCWLFVKVVNGISRIEDTDNTIAKQMETNGWSNVEGQPNVYAYKDIVNALDVQQNIPVFGTFKIAGNADVSDYKTADNSAATITIDAYAVQADGFGTAEAAWAAAPTTWTTTQ